MPLWMALLGCLAGEAAPAAPPPASTRVLELSVTARVEEPGAPAAWTASLRALARPDADGAALPDGVCRSAADVLEPAEPAAGAPLAGLRLEGPMAAALEFDPLRGAHVPIGPRGAVDPAWVIGDLRWNDAASEVRAEGALRFGPVPALASVTREDDGAVTLRWNPETVDDARVYAWGPAGELVCGVGSAGVRLPWWSVPAQGGYVVLASTRGRLTRQPSGVLVWARATVERVIRLDVRASAGIRGAAAPPATRACGTACRKGRKRGGARRADGLG